MIEINLLPEEIKKKKKHAPTKVEVSTVSVSNMPGIPAVTIAIWAAGVILVIQLVVFVISIIGGTTLKSLTLENNGTLPKRQETESLKIKVDAVNKKVAAIDELMIKRFSWDKKLNALSNSIIPGVWLTEVEYNEKVVTDAAKRDPGQAAGKSLSKYLVLSGAVSSMGEEGTAVIGRFIKSLKSDPAFYSDFSDIELGTITREKIGEQEIMTFKITCFLKAE